MKRPRSKLAEYEDEIRTMREEGLSYRAISSQMRQLHDLAVSHNAIASFLRTRERAGMKPTLFYEGLPQDITESLIKQIAAAWTHESTAIEGNTLTLGETVKILELGLTISGKPLKEHEEVYGHAKAIDLIYDLMQSPGIVADDLFDLHRCVMQKSAIDSLRPVGNWKRDYNGTTGVKNDSPIYMEYASPNDTPKLMSRWLREFNRKLSSAGSVVKAINTYTWAHLSFVRIHPFFDGNGRIARLIANLPLLRCGQPPLLVSPAQRTRYIDLLWTYQNAVGTIKRGDRMLPQHETITHFKRFLREEWQESANMVAQARQQAQLREITP